MGYPIPFPGAAWARIGFFAEHWSKKGHAVEILGSLSYRLFNQKGLKELGNVNVFNITINLGLLNPIIFCLNAFFAFLASYLFILAKRPAVTIISVPPGDFCIGAIIACKLLRAKYVIDYRDEWEDYGVSLAKNGLERRFHIIVKRVVTCLYKGSVFISTVTPNFVRILKGRNLKNIALIANGADITLFKPLNIQKNPKFTIFYSGGVGGHYTLDVVIKALKQLNEKGLADIQFVFVGIGEVEKVLNLARALGVSSNVHYCGLIEKKSELVRLITYTDVGIVPYNDNVLWKNSVSAKFYEYCACGLPVLATAYEDSLISTYINKFKIGVVCPPMNHLALANAIEFLYNDASFKIAAGKNARKFVERNFDRAQIAEDFLERITNDE